MNTFSDSSNHWRDRIVAGIVHLGLSLCVALLSALLVFGVWFPYPYRDISGGRELFVLLVAVDVVLGPLITLAVFNRSKSRITLRLDLAIVGSLQVAALVYGLWTVALARPVHMVFEIDRFRVVHAVDVPLDLLARTPTSVTALPLTGPTMLGVRAFENERERMDATVAALQGIQLAFRPDLWQTYQQSVPAVLAVAKPAFLLKVRFPEKAANIDRLLVQFGRNDQNTSYLPMIGRKAYWTVFLDAQTAQVVATMPLDSF